MRYVEVFLRGPSTSLRFARDDGINSSCGETAVDVIFQMCNGGLLAGNHMFHEVANRDHADHLIVVKDRQMANVVVRH